jgi:hypothetical protein
MRNGFKRFPIENIWETTGIKSTNKYKFTSCASRLLVLEETFGFLIYEWVGVWGKAGFSIQSTTGYPKREIREKKREKGFRWTVYLLSTFCKKN